MVSCDHWELWITLQYKLMEAKESGGYPFTGACQRHFMKGIWKYIAFVSLNLGPFSIYLLQPSQLKAKLLSD